MENLGKRINDETSEGNAFNEVRKMIKEENERDLFMSITLKEYNIHVYPDYVQRHNDDLKLNEDEIRAGFILYLIYCYFNIYFNINELNIAQLAVANVKERMFDTENVKEALFGMQYFLPTKKIIAQADRFYDDGLSIYEQGETKMVDEDNIKSETERLETHFKNKTKELSNDIFNIQNQRKQSITLCTICGKKKTHC